MFILHSEKGGVCQNGLTLHNVKNYSLKKFKAVKTMGVTGNFSRAVCAKPFDQYVPGVAKAMRAQGILSFKHLWEKIEPHVKRRPGFFSEVTYHRINSCVLGRKYRVFTDGDYTPCAYAVAAGLNKSVEELFGCWMSATPTIETKEDAKLFFEAWGDPHPDRIKGPLSQIEAAELRKHILLKVEGMATRQKAYVSAAFGLYDAELNSKDIGRLFGTTGQNVRQMIDEVIYHLSKGQRAYPLKDFLFS